MTLGLFTNGSMNIELVSFHSRDIDPQSNCNVAIVRRYRPEDYSTIDYAVVNGFIPLGDKCEWCFAHQYNIDDLTTATQISIKKIS